MANLGDAYVNIVPKAEGISSKVESLLSSGSSGAESAGESIGKKLLRGITALGIGAAVVSTIKSAFEAGGDLQQSYGGLDTIYGDASSAMKEYAQSAAQYGISANTYAEQAVSMGAALQQAFGGDTAAAAESANMAIQDMADNAAKMGTPVENLQTAYQGFAKQNYTMLDNLKLGYGGTKEEMERLLADASELSGVEYNIDNLGDVYDAIHVIQEDLGLTGVAAEEASTTLTGSLDSVKASWTNVMAAMTTGEGLDTALENLTTSLSGFGSTLLSMFGNLIAQAPTLITGLLDAVIENAPSLIAGGAEMVVKLAIGLVNAIPQIVAKIPEMFQAIKTEFLKVDWASLGKSLVTGIITGLKNAVGSLYTAVREMIRNALGAGQDEAEKGSPSRLFARELGKWLPLGVAMGVEDNAEPLYGTMRSLIDNTLAYGQAADLRPISATATSDADRIVSALHSLVLQADVTLEGDARQMFRVIQKQNSVRTKATSYNSLALAGV